jgi:hypothetical protein
MRLCLSITVIIMLFLNSCSSRNKQDLIVGKWQGDSTYVDTSSRYWCEHHENLRGVKEEINKYQWEFFKDSTCYLQSSRSGELRGKYKFSGDTIFASSADKGFEHQYQVLSLTSDELKIKFTSLSHGGTEGCSWVFRFKPIGATSTNTDNPVAPTADERTALAQSNFEQAVSKSNGAIKLDWFKKTNGYEQNAGGMELYVLEWDASVTIQKECWKVANPIFGNWLNFYVLSSPSDPMSYNKPLHFTAGTTILLSGEYTLQKTENGWRVSDDYTLKKQQTVKSTTNVDSDNRSNDNSPVGFTKKVIGTWTGGRDDLFGITFENGKYKIQNCYASSDKGVYYFGKYENGKIIVTGYEAERFYKYQIPTFEPQSDGGLLYSDGADDIKLKKSDVLISDKKRTYALLDPVNND